MAGSATQDVDEAADRARSALHRLMESEVKAGFRAEQARTPAGNGRASGEWSGGARAAVDRAADGVRAALQRMSAGLQAAGKKVEDGATAARRNMVQQINTATEGAVGGLKTLGGEMAAEMGQAMDRLPQPIHAQIDAAIAASSAPVGDFLSANRSAITSTLGALQATGGLMQGVEGAHLIVMGLAASETLPLAALGGWMTARGYDDWDTGVSTLVSGEPQQGGFYGALRDFGLSDTSANLALAATSGLPPSAIDRLSTLQLERAAEPPLLRDAAETLTTSGLAVTPGQDFWGIRGPQPRGLAYQDFDLRQTGLIGTPATFPVFDQYSADGSMAVSNKTIDLEAASYSKEPYSRVATRLKRMIDVVADFKQYRQGETFLTDSTLVDRELHLGVPAGRIAPGQSSLLRAADYYAKTRGVVLRIDHIK